MPLALMKNSAMRPHVPRSSASSLHLAHLSLYVKGLRLTLLWSGGEGRGASSTLGSDKSGDEDMDKATRAAIAHAYEVERVAVGAKAARGKAARAGTRAGSEAGG